MKAFLDIWTEAAESLFAQALAGEPQLAVTSQEPSPENTFGFAATLTGDPAGRFSVFLDAMLLETPLLGEGTDQKVGWGELLREVAESTCGELLVRTGKQCRIARFETVSKQSGCSRAFQISTSDHAWTIVVHDEVRPTLSESACMPDQDEAGPPHPSSTSSKPADRSAGVELLLDVELAASLRFGSREMPLAEVLDLGPGDVVQLDRHVADPVDLVVGDKIVARGEVVLVNGNFGLRVTEVAEPRSRLESIRCLF